jgi:peptidylprolyl isomerase
MRGLATAAAVSSLALLAACGDETVDDVQATATLPTDTGAVETTPELADPTTTVAADVPPKPEVSIPSEQPTELITTDLADGAGDPAVEGDTVVVHYVGVRSVDGTEFDNSYDGGEPLSVTLGSGQVIPGWEQGLLGVTQGMQRQLDIPADLAYGDTPQGDVIQPGDALTFVVDVVAVIPAGDPADAPADTVEPSENQDEIAIEDVVEGDGAVVEPDQNVAVQISAYRADTGEKVTSTWDSGATPFTFVANDESVLAGIRLGIEDMAVGGRRQVHVPYLLAFGETGNPDFGLPASTDMVLIIDLVAAY